MALAISYLRSFLPAKDKNDEEEESTPFLGGGPSPTATTDDSLDKPDYGGVVKGKVIGNDNHQVEGTTEEFKMASMGWIPYLRRFAIMFPSIWPTSNRKLQLHILGSLLCEVASRFFKIIAPLQLGILIHRLSDGSGQLPIYELLAYLLFDWIESSEPIDTIKEILWVPVEQNAHKSCSLMVYKHVMEMSSDYHDNVLLSDLYQAIDQGTSLYNLLETILFTIVPMLIDLFVACTYLTLVFGYQMSTVVFTTAITYLYMCRYFTQKVTEAQRGRIEARRQENRVLHDSINCWLSVAYFNNFSYELNRYSEALNTVMKRRLKSDLWSRANWTATQFLLNVGYAGVVFIASYRVSHGTLESVTIRGVIELLGSVHR